MNEKLGPIVYDVAAMDACRQNNKIQCGPTVMTAPFGGNIYVICKLVGVKVAAEEITMSRFLESDGCRFVALQLILDFDKKCESPLLKPDTTRVGISNMPNRNCNNLIQVLYVSIPMQPPTEQSMREWQEQ